MSSSNGFANNAISIFLRLGDISKILITLPTSIFFGNMPPNPDV